RLKQQYFFVACALRDIVRRHLAAHGNLERFADKVAIQLNDTHPAIAIPELMRLLVDEHGQSWDQAWETAVRTFGYTNHTILWEGLEKWPVAMFEQLFPRHLEIIYEINRRLLREVLIRYPFDEARLQRMSLIEEPNFPGAAKQIRMAYVAVAGSHTTNGVSELHTRLLTSGLLREFYELWPDRFRNATNGVTPRRWLLVANPKLARAITARLGRSWLTDLEQLE